MDPGHRISETFDRAFAHELALRADTLATPDPEEAARLVVEAEQAAWQTVRSFAAQSILLDSKRREQEVANEARRASIFAERRATEEKEGRRALKQVFGRKLADQIELWESYVVVESAPHVFAIPDRHETAIRQHLGGGTVLGQAEGIRLIKLLARLDDGPRLDAVLSDEASIAKAIELVQAAEQARRDEEAAARQAHAKTTAKLRDRQRQEQSYGVALTDE